MRRVRLLEEQSGIEAVWDAANNHDFHAKTSVARSGCVMADLIGSKKLPIGLCPTSLRQGLLDIRVIGICEFRIDRV
jgi:hypothetical protein